MGPSCPSPVGKMLGSPVQKPTLHRSISTKVLLAEGDDSPFTEHCRHFENSYRVRGPGTCQLVKAPPLLAKVQWPNLVLATWPASRPSTEAPAVHPACRKHRHSRGLSPQRLQAEMQNLKDQVQELHRDLTKHHSLIKAEIMGDILHKSLQVDTQIALEYASVEGMRAVFQEVALPEEPPSPAAPPVSMHMSYPRTGRGRRTLAWCPRRPSCGRLWNLGLCCLEPRELAGSALWL